MFLTLPALLDADELASVRALLSTAPWADGRIGAGSQAVQAKNNEQLPAACAAPRRVGATVLHALERSPQFLAACLPRKIFPPRINRYGGDSNYYGKHVDGAIRFSDGGLRVRTDISCTVFLSEPDEYDGGELTMEQLTRAVRWELAKTGRAAVRAPRSTTRGGRSA